jgi:hypothetical protein
MSIVKQILTVACHRGDTEYQKEREEERKYAEYQLLVSFCKGEIGGSVTLNYDNGIVLKNSNIYLPRYIFIHILSYKGMDWLLHSGFPKLMRGYRRRNRLIRSFCEKARLNHLSRVNFENIPIGTFFTFKMIMGNWYNHTWDANQKKEFRRLMGKAYANGTDGYKNKWLYAKDINNDSIIKTSAAGNGKNNIRNQIISYCNNNNTWDKLPLPLKILYKVRIPSGGNWPRDDNNNIDLTADILWPENRADVQNFFKKVPSISDFEYYGW